jgi:hypothetical protein
VIKQFKDQKTMSEAPMTDEPKRKRGNPNFVVGGPGGPGRKPKVWTAKELMDKKIRQDLKEAAKEHTAEAFNFMLEVLRDTDANTKDRMSAANFIVERGWGKAVTHTETKIDIYQNMSDSELIRLITGKEIDAELIEQARAPLVIDHEPSDTDEEESYEEE